VSESDVVKLDGRIRALWLSYCRSCQYMFKDVCKQCTIYKKLYSLIGELERIRLKQSGVVVKP
jgi:hypothetical protein